MWITLLEESRLNYPIKRRSWAKPTPFTEVEFHTLIDDKAQRCWCDLGNSNPITSIIGDNRSLSPKSTPLFFIGVGTLMLLGMHRRHAILCQPWAGLMGQDEHLETFQFKAITLSMKEMWVNPRNVCTEDAWHWQLCAELVLINIEVARNHIVYFLVNSISFLICQLI